MVQGIYGIVLLAEIYTTAVANLYGFTTRVTEPTDRRFRKTATAVAACAFTASIVGFSSLVRYLYAAVGIAGFVLLAGLTSVYFRERKNA